MGEGCSGCGLCVVACPDKAITLNEIGPEIDRNLCLNCGKCARVCPTGTIYFGKTGFRVVRGGKLGRRPMLAREICGLTDVKGVVEPLNQTIEFL